MIVETYFGNRAKIERWEISPNDATSVIGNGVYVKSITMTGKDFECITRMSEEDRHEFFARTCGYFEP